MNDRDFEIMRALEHKQFLGVYEELAQAAERLQADGVSRDRLIVFWAKAMARIEGVMPGFTDWVEANADPSAFETTDILF